MVLDDRFEITDLINRSGMASIFKANDRKTGLTVAVKIPLMQFESDAASFSRFEREEEIGKTLTHPYILRIFAVPPEEKSRPYIVMEYLQGQTLAALLRQVHPLPEPDAAKIASRICEALDYMHFHQIVHRDLKPQNIMICNDGSIRIMDFGIAKSLKMRRITFVGFSPSMGTPDYMAPEQVKGKRGDERTDIYCLGAILYEMCTGQTPFEGESPYAVMNARLTGDPIAPRKINPKLTAAIEEIILHALERDPANRFPNALAMKAELDDYEKVELVERYRRLQTPQLWKSRFRLLPLILLFALAQVVIFLVLILYFKHHPK
jgi:serine/threonine-protein kinase